MGYIDDTARLIPVHPARPSFKEGPRYLTPLLRVRKLPRNGSRAIGKHACDVHLHRGAARDQHLIQRWRMKQSFHRVAQAVTN
jgi:hypothetical protein